MPNFNFNIKLTPKKIKRKLSIIEKQVPKRKIIIAMERQHFVMFASFNALIFYIYTLSPKK